MKVIDLIQKVNFEEAWKELIPAYYSDKTADELTILHDKYYCFAEKLKTYSYTANNDIIIVDSYYEDGKKEPHVCMYSGEDDVIYSLMFIDWEKVLGFEVFDYSLEEFSEAATLAHILWEVSYFGFEEEMMQDEKTKLDAACEEIEGELIGLDEVKDAETNSAPSTTSSFLDSLSPQEKEDALKNQKIQETVDRRVREMYAKLVANA